MKEHDGEREHRWLLRAVYAILTVVVLGVLWSRVRPREGKASDAVEHTSSADSFVGPLPLEPLTVSPNASRVIRWCAVRDVLERRCLRCHGAPRSHGAPFSLISYADVSSEYPPGSGSFIVDRMAQAVRHRAMPPTTLPLDPPVEPLDDREKDTLLAWLEEGALPFGGESCPP